MKIYTKFGDQGQTRLVGGECVQKNNPRVECYGTVDELNSTLGFAISQIDFSSAPEKLKSLKSYLIQIQNELFNVGSLLACEKAETLSFLPPVQESHIKAIEGQIDLLTQDLAPLKNFILPGGSPFASALHVCRTVCRRAERNTVGLIEDLQPQLSPPELLTLNTCLIYLNRLSDFLFTAARFANFSMGIEDQVWKK